MVLLAMLPKQLLTLSVLNIFGLSHVLKHMPYSGATILHTQELLILASVLFET